MNKTENIIWQFPICLVMERLIATGRHPSFVESRSERLLGVLLTEYREFLEEALWPFFGVVELDLGL